MKKLVVAGMLCLAAMAASERDAFALSLFGMHIGPRGEARQSAPPAPLAQQPESGAPIMVQSSDAEVRVQQMEDQMRQLNGRIEEMSYQLLQMQEQIRKTQEDNEFRFQQLEKKGGGGGGATSGGNGVKKSEADTPPAPGAASGGDDVARVIGTPQNNDISEGDDAPATSAQGGGPGKPPSQLGSIQFDQAGKPVGGSVDSQAGKGSGAAPAQGGGATQTASLGSESDSYKAAYGHVLSGDYGVAEQEFRQYISSYPNSTRMADANFWLGEALYSQAKYNDAAKTFLNAHQKYGTSEKAPEMLLKLGMSLAALDNKDTACATFKEVTKRYPKASRAVVTKVSSEEKRLAC